MGDWHVFRHLCNVEVILCFSLRVELERYGGPTSGLDLALFFESFDLLNVLLIGLWQ